MDFGTIDALVPELYGVPSWRQLRAPRPRLLKSHETFDHRYGSTIYLVRDPRDVCISLFHYSRKRELVPDDADLGDFVDAFTTRPDWAFGRWDEHVGSWLGAVGGSPRFLLVRYEDCIAEPHTQIARAASHLGIAADEGRIAEIVATYGIDEMRKLEASSLTAGSPSRPARGRTSRSSGRAPSDSGGPPWSRRRPRPSPSGSRRRWSGSATGTRPEPGARRPPGRGPDRWRRSGSRC